MAWRILAVMVMVIAAVSETRGDERVLRCEAVIEATPAEVWEAYTTKAGWESWAVPLAEVDFRVGGTIRTNYNKEAGIGGPGTITHHIIAYEPERVVVTRFESEGNAAWAKKAEACQVIMRLEPVSAARTRFTLTMTGWGGGAEWDDSYLHFKEGNEATLARLRKKFEKAGAAEGAAAALAMLGRMVGGEWVCEQTAPNGSLFRVRNVAEWAPDGKGTFTRGWLGGVSGMSPHACTLAWREGDRALFQSLDQDGGVARGELKKVDEQTLNWEWNQSAADGKVTRYTVVQTFDGADTYRMRLLAAKDGGAQAVVVNIVLHRVARAPAEFLKMRGDSTGRGPSVASIDPALFPASGMVTNPVVKEVVVKASPNDVFESWATAAGIKGFLGCESNVELRIGGPYEIFFGGADVPEADRGSNGCQVLSYVPGEMISFSWNAPPKFPAERAQRAWVVVSFAAEEPGYTRVRLVHTGFGSDGKWPEVREYFDAAWGRVLGALKEHFER